MLGSFQPHVAFGSFIKIPCRDYFFHLLQNIVAPSMCKNKDCPILSGKEWGGGREQHVSLVLLLTTEVPCPATFPFGFSLRSPCSVPIPKLFFLCTQTSCSPSPSRAGQCSLMDWKLKAQIAAAHAHPAPGKREHSQECSSTSLGDTQAPGLWEQGGDSFCVLSVHPVLPGPEHPSQY